jgi:hypothetical protein
VPAVGTTAHGRSVRLRQASACRRRAGACRPRSAAPCPVP